MITDQEIIIGIRISKERVSFGICNKIIAGREIYITNLFNRAADSCGKTLNLLKQ